MEAALDIATQTHLKQQREALLYRQRELVADLHAAEMLRKAQAASTSGGVLDQKDIAESQRSSGLDAAQEQRDLEEAALVAAALKRLDEGSYGDCLDCGQPIALQRLRVQPAAPRCAACQTAYEQGREMVRR
jgi:DnaK suppressor protein